MAKARILVVEDDPHIQRMLQTQLAARDYEIQIRSSGAEAVSEAKQWEPDLVLLDIGLGSGMDGMSVCQKIRERSAVPIIMVTAADAPMTKMTALELGADDYLTKPFHMGELIARMRAVMRRTAREAEPRRSSVTVGDIEIDMERREVRRNGAPLHLTRTEFALLSELASHSDQVLSYGHLLKKVWGEEGEDVRPVHVHMCHLRRKIEKAPLGQRLILAVPGVGYRLRMSEAELLAS